MEELEPDRLAVKEALDELRNAGAP
jgi:hypothetical protein